MTDFSMGVLLCLNNRLQMLSFQSSMWKPNDPAHGWITVYGDDAAILAMFQSDFVVAVGPVDKLTRALLAGKERTSDCTA